MTLVLMMLLKQHPWISVDMRRLDSRQAESRIVNKGGWGGQDSG